MNQKITKKVRAPVRIDFAGGTTDIEPFVSRHHGCVLNAAINKYVTGILVADSKKTHLEYTGNIPTSSGLGTSGVMNLVWLALISKEKDKKKLAENVYKLEQSQGLIGGKQDQYASALGGINFLEFNKGEVKITSLNLNKRLIQELENHLVLVYTGKPHFSGNSNKKMIDNIISGKNIQNLIRIKNIAIEMKNSLLLGNLDRFAELMNEETENRKKLHYSIVPERIESIIEKSRENGAIAAKICGSGGGGSILFYGDKKRLKNYFKDKIIDFKFDFKGLEWINSG